MAEVFAGFVVGYALARLAAPAGAIALVRSNDRTGFAQRVAPPGTNVIALSMVIHFAALLVFTAIGLVLGMALAGLNDRHPQDGLGSPNLIYTVMVIAITVIIVLPIVAIPSIRRPVGVFALVLLVVFGWVLPWVATLG
jgi:hypothetical protein